MNLAGVGQAIFEKRVFLKFVRPNENKGKLFISQTHVHGGLFRATSNFPHTTEFFPSASGEASWSEN